MKELDLVQGSQEWLDTRAKRFTASEAPAMMGESKYMSRSELLKQKATGLVPDVSEMLQSIFDKGHTAEDNARPIAESITEEDLYPTTAVCDNDTYLASFDGITMLGDVVWEHKLWNLDLVRAVQFEDLPPTYYWQLEQQLMVSGAEKVLFMCSDGTEDNMVYMWYFPVDGRREQLIAGWNQFAIDLSSYELPESPATVIGAEIKDLPALVINIEGKVLSSNLDVFESKAMAVISAINTDLQTDQDFADAEKAVKFCTKAEKDLKDTKEKILSQAADIDIITKSIDRIAASTRETRLHIAKLVKNEKDSKRAAIVIAAKQAFHDHMQSIQSGLSGVTLPLVDADFAQAIKGKKTLTSIQSAADDELAKAKIEANANAEIIRKNLTSLSELASEHKFLFSDHAMLLLKDNSDLINLIKARISDHENAEAARLEAQRIQMEADAKAKAEQERENIRLEEEAKAKQKFDAEQKEIQEADNLATQGKAETTPTVKIISKTPVIEAATPDATYLRRFVDPSANAERTVTITISEYKDLLARSALLQALENHGVDNWTGYQDALNEFNNQKAA